MAARAHAVRRWTIATVVVALLAGTCGAALSACSQAPTVVPVRTFERAQRMDVACLRLFDHGPADSPNELHAIAPVGRPQGECAPVPSNVDGSGFVKQLFAFVTQTTRGELAVVDLSAGGLVDQSRATPGINFIPVGALPTDVAATPDGKMVFVASAETNKPAIYGIPTRRILGDRPGFPRDPAPMTLGSWPVCALPQNPGAITVVPRRLPVAGVDGGAGAGTEMRLDYDLVVVLPGDRQNSAKILTLDPRPFRRGGMARLDGKRDYASDTSDGDPVVVEPDTVPVLEPGTLRSCADFQISAVELVDGDTAMPKSFVPGPVWDNGVSYDGGGGDPACNRPTAPECGRPCCPPDQAPRMEAGAPDGGAAADSGTDAGTEAGASTCQAEAKDAGPVDLQLAPLESPRLVSIVRDEQMLYIADEGAPLIHVLDLSTPSAPRRLPPLLATSLADPGRAVSVKDLAISPPTRDYKRFLYAVDRSAGSLIVYDVTDPASAQRTPLLRPHPELNPFQPADRIGFGSPVVAVTFARHDVPLPTGASGLLCNPNKNLEAPNTQPLEPVLGADPGYFYRADRADPGLTIGPRRLRGIFGFATLASGQVVAINVDDWDSPCRRPDDMSKNVSDVPTAQTDGSLDAYHTPSVTPGAVTNEVFFPMSAPHSLRSDVLIKSDQPGGNQVPRIVSTPTASSNGQTLPFVGPGSEKTPLLKVTISLDEAQAHTDQNWSIGYELPLPGLEGLSAEIATEDAYESLILRAPQARFCAKGVEDWDRGIDRTRAIHASLGDKGSPRAEYWMTDYVQLTEDLLDVSDPYWSLGNSASTGHSCWDGDLGLAAASGPTRHDRCERTFGALGSDQLQTRDFPIVQAFDDRVVLGRFAPPPGDLSTPGPSQDQHRVVVGRHPSNEVDLRLMQCCFHHQVRFTVRTGQLWGAIGSSPGGGPGVGFFSHLTPDSAGRCVSSCDSRESLLNGRLPTLPTGIVVDDIRRNSPLALRNPMFWAVLVGSSNGAEPSRDTVYSFSTRGQFRTLAVSIGGTSISVNPQSMRFVEPLGQIAVVDGASQGLVLIDLRGVTLARAPYF